MRSYRHPLPRDRRNSSSLSDTTSTPRYRRATVYEGSRFVSFTANVTCTRIASKICSMLMVRMEPESRSGSGTIQSRKRRRKELRRVAAMYASYWLCTVSCR